ncbi:hypothetical protein NKF26_05840 [Haladaptatus sp. AB618]|uniref:hypothetical protein n=1 Tax=Haladaptatus sp. AB618 TaxID=2934173 RepID=UPI00209C17F3|nr:hypothetical protein [Haladaptatus sp. AB618]MCO8253326.1 hypothetical protein [Haladaptatus sp. AB618]
MLDELRKPEYTGENRCWPCTVLNAIILLSACAGVIKFYPGKRTRRLGVASAVGIVGGAAIALRGYLVPGTPQIAPKLAARLSPKPQPPAETGSLAGETDEDVGERALSALLDAGIVHAVGESLHLDEGFRTDWRDEMTTLRSGNLGTAVRNASPSLVTTESVNDDEYIVVTTDGDEIENERWLSRPVAIAEVAATRALDEYDIDPDVRVQSASALRAFLNDCPVCDAPLEVTSADNCCGSGTSSPLAPPDEVLACPDCDQRVFTF